MKWSMIGVNGTLRDLETGPVLVGRQPRVFGPPPASLLERQSHALTAGAIAGKARDTSRPIVVPFLFNCTSQDELYETIEEFASETDPVSGEIRLIADRDDGTKREIVGRRSGGLDSMPIDHALAEWTEVDVTIRCTSPYWYDVLPTTVELNFPVSGTGVTSTPFSDARPFSDVIPFNGWEPSPADTVLQTIDYVGTAPVWPVFEFDGPLTSIACTNMTSGRTWVWNQTPHATLAAGETARFETSELSRSVRVGDQNRYRGFDIARRDLWPLDPQRENEILIEVSGAAGTTAARMYYQNAWKTC